MAERPSYVCGQANAHETPSGRSRALYDSDALRQGIAVLKRGLPFEARILDGKRFQDSRGQNLVGYFDSAEALLAGLAALNLRSYKGIYLTLNELKDGILARGRNRFDTKIKATSDADIARRRWLFVDIDPKRPAEISATEEEKAHGKAIADRIAGFTRDNGWGDPVIADSGNGYHLLYAIDLEPNSTLVANILRALADRFDDRYASIDTSVTNASRIIKISGTWSCKRDNDEKTGRIHRLDRLLFCPEEEKVLSEEDLELLLQSLRANLSCDKIDRMDKIPESALGAHSRADAPFDEILTKFDRIHPGDLAALLGKYFPLAGEAVPYDGGLRWALETCPFDPGHGRSASVFFFPAGSGDFTATTRPARATTGRTWRSGSSCPPEKFSNGARSSGKITGARGTGAESFFQKFAPLPPPPMDIFEQDFLNALMEEIAETIPVPREVVLLSMVTLLGFAQGGRLSISPKRGFTVKQNLFSWFFMGTGERKSTTHALLVRPIEDWIRARPEPGRDGFSCSIITENGTPEGQRELMRKTGGILGLFSDDARAAMQVLNGRYSDGQSYEADSVKYYDGNCSIYIVRKEGGDFRIDNPCMSRLEMVQPDWIQKIGCRPDFFASGFLSRTIICIPDPMAGTRNADGNLKRAFNGREVPQKLMEDWAAMLGKCLDLFVGTMDKKNYTQNIVVPLSESALEHWKSYHDHCEGDLAAMAEREKSFAVRYSNTVLRIALLRVVLRAVERIDQPLPADPALLRFGAAIPEDIEAGIRLVEYFRHHHRRFLAAIDDSPSSLNNRVDNFIKQKGSCTARDLQRHFGKVKADEILDACEELKLRSSIRELPTQPNRGAGRPPSPTYVSVDSGTTSPGIGI